MTTGDKNDILQRLKSTLPRQWFADESPVLDAILAGIASSLAYAYGAYSDAKLQTRVLTATGGWLDLISNDFFGLALRRKSGQSDASFRQVILANLFRERGTRKGLSDALEALTGSTPTIFEPHRAQDAGGYNVVGGYGVAGGYGSLLYPYQCFVELSRPTGQSVPWVAGYGISTGGYNTGSRAAYSSEAEVFGTLSEADVLATIQAVKPVGTVVWLRYRDPLQAEQADMGIPAEPETPGPVPLLLDGSWKLDGSQRLNGVRA